MKEERESKDRQSSAHVSAFNPGRSGGAEVWAFNYLRVKGTGIPVMDFMTAFGIMLTSWKAFPATSYEAAEAIKSSFSKMI